MYSRDFSDNRSLPPQYDGTVLGRRGEAPPEQRREEPCGPPPPERKGGEPCREDRKPPSPPKKEAKGNLFPLFERLLPEGIDSSDLLLLGLAILLLLDGCEDELLPILLLFLLIVH